MPTNMHDIERAYELGRAAERQKMADLASLMNSEKLANLTNVVSTPHPKTAAAPKQAKAPTVARGIKKAAATRTKGVKEAIINLIASEALAVPDIVSRLGFKEGSVRAVLMGLKKDGRTVQDDKLWSLRHTSESGNSESEHATV